MNIKNRKQQGFTIIEVLIVLSIAALILIIIFFAVPALQRNSRNTQTRSDAATVLGFVNDFAGANNGTSPGVICYDNVSGNVGMVVSGTCSPTANLVGKIRTSNSATYLAAATGTPLANPSTANLLAYRIGGKCTTVSPFTVNGDANPRSVSIGFKIETAGGTTDVCQET